MRSVQSVWGRMSGRRMGGRGARVALAAGLIGLAPVGGCDWKIEKEQVKKDVCKAIEDWYARALVICNSIPDQTERTKCLLQMAADNTALSKKKVELLAAQVNCDETKWKSVADVVKAVLDALAKIVPTAMGLVSGVDGKVNANALAVQEGNGLVFQPGSMLGLAYGADGDMEFQPMEGTMALTMEPDGQGGFVGTVDAFNLSLEFFGEQTAVSLAPDALPTVAQVNAIGQGFMRMHLLVENDFLIGSIAYVELPIQALPPFQVVQISTGGDVPGEKIQPQFVPDPKDCDGNGITDIEEVMDGSAPDCNGDLVPDICQMGAMDCNGNGVLDECDLKDGTLHDADGNGLPDECEPKPPCYPDYTGDGELDLFDFLGYVNSFNAGEDRADCTLDGVLDLFDFLCFVNGFNEGC